MIRDLGIPEVSHCGTKYTVYHRGLGYKCTGKHLGGGVLIATEVLLSRK